jgi:hypothetical protein
MRLQDHPFYLRYSVQEPAIDLGSRSYCRKLSTGL